MYEGGTRVTYLDKPHAYYAQERVNYKLLETDDKAWGPKWRPKGTTTILGDTLEKKGLAVWMAGQPLAELFGFYDFEPEPGKRLTGFTKNKGTMWDGDSLLLQTKAEALPRILSASKAWQRKQKTGADIGSLCHDYIEQYTLGAPFELTLEKYEEGQEFADERERQAWLVTAPAELEMARKACERFVEWWTWQKPELLSAEQIVYSKQFDVSGAYDCLLKMDGRIIVGDYKTSNASVSAGAPQGVYYSHFIQSAIYALALLEMGAVEKIDDLMIISCRKDGSFDVVLASDVGLQMEEALDWAKAVLLCSKLMYKTKRELVAHARAAALL